MFGFGVPEFTVLFIIVVVALVIRKMANKGGIDMIQGKGASMTFGSNHRECLQCGYIGPMKTWLSNYNFPQFVLLLGLLFLFLPGLIFWAWAWGKHKCPRCGALGKSVQGTTKVKAEPEEKACPFCAETIKLEAIVCKHCQRELPQASA